jgi:hypothetical protein
MGLNDLLSVFFHQLGRDVSHNFVNVEAIAEISTVFNSKVESDSGAMIDAMPDDILDVVPDSIHSVRFLI